MLQNILADREIRVGEILRIAPVSHPEDAPNCGIARIRLNAAFDDVNPDIISILPIEQ